MHKAIRVIFLIILWLILLGQVMPMTLMEETGDPWYIEYTTWWFLLSGLIFYPATAISILFKQPIHGILHWLLNITWAFSLSYFIYKLNLQKLNKIKI